MKRNAIFAVVVAAIAAAALALVACGDDDDRASEGTSGSGLSFPGMAAESGVDRDDAVAVREEAAAEPIAPPSGDGQQPGQTNADLLGRTIIRNGSVSLVVESVAGGFDRVSAIASAHGGFVANSSFFADEDDNGARPVADSVRDIEPDRRFQGAHLTLRVPASRFDAVIRELQDLAVRVTSISTSSQDVTEEYTDLQSQLRNLRAVEARYIDLLSAAESVEEILLVQDRLNQTLAQIEYVQGRINLLDSLADLATLNVELRTPSAPAILDEDSKGPLDAARGAWDASLATLSAIATVALVAVVFSWWIVPLLVLLAVVIRITTGAWLPRPPRRPAPPAPAE